MDSRAFWIALALVVVGVSGQIENDAKLQKKIRDCFDETNVPVDKRTPNPMGLLDHADLKCFAACMMEKKGTMINNKIDPEKQYALIKSDSYEAVKPIISRCSLAANEQMDKCEVAHSYVKCLIKTIHSHPK